MYFRDLEPYGYDVPEPLKDVVAIGWLSKDNQFPRGETTAEFLSALERLLSTHRVNQSRGFHVCEFCAKSPLTHRTQPGRTIMLGSAEIWLPSLEQAVVYAAPDLIVHYVTEHRYFPPNDFIRAALHACNDVGWDANSECESRLDAAFGSERK